MSFTIFGWKKWNFYCRCCSMWPLREQRSIFDASLSELNLCRLLTVEKVLSHEFSFFIAICETVATGNVCFCHVQGTVSHLLWSFYFAQTPAPFKQHKQNVFRLSSTRLPCSMVYGTRLCVSTAQHSWCACTPKVSISMTEIKYLAFRTTHPVPDALSSRPRRRQDFIYHDRPIN